MIEVISNNKIDNYLKNLNNNIIFWNKIINKDIKIICLCVNENEYDFLCNQLNKFNMKDAIPNYDSFKINYNKTLFGGGAPIKFNEEDCLFFWQVIGSSLDFDKCNVGVLKTPGHLYSHAAQGYIYEKLGTKTTDFPGWIVEGQSDYYPIKLLSNSDLDYEINRESFKTTAFVPHGIREIIKNWNEKDWLDALQKDTGPHEGIKQTSQYYSGFFMYEFLVKNFGDEVIFKIMKDFTDSKNFKEAFEYNLKLKLNDFYKNMSKEIAKNSSEIRV